MRTTVTHLILAARPRTLFAGLSPVLLGLAVAVPHGPVWGIGLLTLTCCLLLQIGTNLANDYFDAQSGVDTADRLGPVRVTQQELLSPKTVRNAFLACFGAVFFLAMPLFYHGGPVVVVIGFFSMAGAYLYSGGPWPLSHHGLGETAAFLFFGPVAVCGTFYLQTHFFSGEVLWVSLGPGFLAALLMSVNNIRDIATDRQAGKVTLPVMLGEHRARVIAMGFFFGAMAVPVLYFLWFSRNSLLLAVPLSGLLYGKSLRLIRNGPVDASFNAILANTGKLFFVYAILFCVGIVQ